MVPKASDALGQLLKSEIDYNVVIYVGREQKEFRAHSGILRCGSKIFDEILAAGKGMDNQL